MKIRIFPIAVRSSFFTTGLGVLYEIYNMYIGKSPTFVFAATFFGSLAFWAVVWAIVPSKLWGLYDKDE